MFVGFSLYDFSSSIQNTQNVEFNGLKKNFFSSSTLNGNNDTNYELTDNSPSYIWIMEKEEVDKIMIKAEEGYKISVSIVECSFENYSSYLKISPSKYVSIHYDEICRRIIISQSIIVNIVHY